MFTEDSFIQMLRTSLCVLGCLMSHLLVFLFCRFFNNTNLSKIFQFCFSFELKKFSSFFLFSVSQTESKIFTPATLLFFALPRRASMQRNWPTNSNHANRTTLTKDIQVSMWRKDGGENNNICPKEKTNQGQKLNNYTYNVPRVLANKHQMG